MEDAAIQEQLAGKRVTLLLGSFVLGGAERQGLHLARYLKENVQARVEVWAAWQHDRSAERAVDICEQLQLPWKHVPFVWGSSRLGRILRVYKYGRQMQKLNPGFLLPYTMFPNVICGNTWRWAKARGCIWNQRDEGRERQPIRWERRAVKQTRCFISNSNHGAEFLQNVLGAPKDMVHVVHNGVAPEPALRTPGVWRDEIGVRDDAFLVCMVANVTEFKDHFTLLRAWRLVLDQAKSRGIDAVLLLAGKLGAPEIPLKALAYDLDVGSTVRFLGFVKDVTGLLQAVNLGVFSSKLEGIPNGLLECMAAGLPVVGTDIPGIREAVGPKGFDCLAAPDDASALAERIIRFILDRQLATEAGRLARQRITEDFSVEKMCRRTTALIHSTMTERGESIRG
jgi:glycosyltransferase involved in cell wall biosynthesis